MIYLLPWNYDHEACAHYRQSIDLQYNVAGVTKESFCTWSIWANAYGKNWPASLFDETIFALTEEGAKKRCDKRLLATGNFEFVDEERAEKLRLLI